MPLIGGVEFKAVLQAGFRVRALLEDVLQFFLRGFYFTDLIRQVFPPFGEVFLLLRCIRRPLQISQL